MRNTSARRLASTATVAGLAAALCLGAAGNTAAAGSSDLVEGALGGNKCVGFDTGHFTFVDGTASIAQAPGRPAGTADITVSFSMMPGTTVVNYALNWRNVGTGRTGTISGVASEGGFTSTDTQQADTGTGAVTWEFTRLSTEAASSSLPTTVPMTLCHGTATV